MTDQTRTIIVTGANSGIGLATAEELARQGAHVVMTARDRTRGEAAVTQVRDVTGSERVELLQLDLASLASVRAAAAEANERFPKVDVLINNAGITSSERRVTDDGFELQFQVNQLAPFLFTQLLLPALERAEAGRIVNVASLAHKQAGVLGEDLQGENMRYVGLRQYARTKLMNILWTLELARRLSGSTVTANSLHPGTVRTGWGADGDAKGVFAFLLRIARVFFLSPAKGARTSVYLALSPKVAGISGKYFVRRRSARPRANARDSAAAKWLWDELVAMLALESPDEKSV